MKMSKKLMMAAALMTAVASQASIVNFGLTGNTSYDGWDDLSSSAFPAQANPGPWAPMGSNEGGSGDAALSKLTGSALASSASLYTLDFTPTNFPPPVASSTFSLSDATALSGAETIVLAFDYGAGAAASFTTGPSLTINGATALGAADRVLNLGSRTENVADNDVTIFTDVYQWDLRGEGAVTSFSIEYDMGAHSQQYAIQLEQSDAYTDAIPEPATMVLLGGAGLIMAFIRRMRIC